MNTETELKYKENVRFNLEAAKSLRIETAKYILETKAHLLTIDGRKKTERETIAQRIDRAVAHETDLRDKIQWLDTMETLTEEAALIDNQIAALVIRRKALIDITKPDPFKSKWHGMI
jgi:hypothetical protein